MNARAAITLSRDCNAVLIPEGTPISLPEGTVVYITQALGGSVTVHVNGNLARISGKDVDAVGLEPASIAAETSGLDMQDAVWEVLRTCYDPEIPINIVELGLVYGCQLRPVTDNEGLRAEVVMTLTAPGCGMGQVLVDDVKQKLLELPGIVEADVDLTFDPPWHQGMMSDAARLQTGLY
jgi:probable FeS assembly SUF system protein SufT